MMKKLRVGQVRMLSTDFAWVRVALGYQYIAYQGVTECECPGALDRMAFIHKNTEKDIYYSTRKPCSG